MSLHSPKFSATDRIPCPNIYVKMIPDYEGWVYVDEAASSCKGKWAQEFLRHDLPLDLEIGCGTGFFFEHLAKVESDRNHLGIEIKYKPMIQTARRVRKLGASHSKVIRYHAGFIEDLFALGELNNVHIHFPDPWPKKKHRKHRLLQPEFFHKIHALQKSGSWIDFKTDSQDYFESVMEFVSQIPYEVTRETRDLHNSEWRAENFETAFERIFLRQKLPIAYCRFLRK